MNSKFLSWTCSQAGYLFNSDCKPVLSIRIKFQTIIIPHENWKEFTKFLPPEGRFDQVLTSGRELRLREIMYWRPCLRTEAVGALGFDRFQPRRFKCFIQTSSGTSAYQLTRLHSLQYMIMPGKTDPSTCKSFHQEAAKMFTYLRRAPPGTSTLMDLPRMTSESPSY